jgi:hypothetical protein
VPRLRAPSCARVVVRTRSKSEKTCSAAPPAAVKAFFFRASSLGARIKTIESSNTRACGSGGMESSGSTGGGGGA